MPCNLMAFYAPIFSIDVEHTYFSNGRWDGLDFTPASFCLGFIDNVGFLVRPHENGVRVYFNHNRRKALSLWARDHEAPPTIVFNVFSKDSRFRVITELSRPDENTILYFDSQNTEGDATGRFRLHDAAYVTDQDSEPLNSPRLAGVISREGRWIKPVCVVAIQLSPTTIQKLAAGSGVPCQEYYLRFGAKQTFWKYYLSGRLNDVSAFIHDLNDETAFEDTGQVVMPNHQTAQTFRSGQRLFLRQKSGYRFRLKESTANGRRILIKRLPVASAGQFTRETIKGQEAIVSEIFING